MSSVRTFGVLTVLALFLLAGCTGQAPQTFTGGTVTSVSKTTLNDKPAFLVSVLGGSGADGLTAEVSKDVYPNWDTNKNLFIELGKKNDRYTYRLTERTGSAKTVNWLKLQKECQGADFWNNNACNAVGQPFSYSFTAFKTYCRSLDANAMAFSSGDLINPHWRCYVPLGAWVIADFDRVGGIYEPEVYVTAMTYQRGTQPWLGNGQFEKVAQVLLSRTAPSANLVTTTGENIGKATITNMAPTFTSPPPSTAVKAVSLPTTPRQFAVVDANFDNSAQQLINQLSSCLSNAQRGTGSSYGINLGFGIIFPIYGDYDETSLTQCLNVYNANVAGLKQNNPRTGDFARSDIALDTSAINTNGTISIKNSFALPSLAIWAYTSSMGVVSANAIPSSISCTSTEMLAGASSSIRTTIVNGMTAGVLHWSASCGTPITVSQASGDINAGPYQSQAFDIPISSGIMQGVSTCTVTGKSTDLTASVSGTCTVNVNRVCNDPVPPGCHIQPTPENPCAQNCTIPPVICSDGTRLGQCNVQNKRCVMQNAVATLTDDSTCAGCPAGTIRCPDGSCLTSCIVPPPKECLAFFEEKITTTTGGFSFLGIQLWAGTAATSCQPYIPAYGLLMIVAGILGFLYGNREDDDDIKKYSLIFAGLGFAVIVAVFLYANLLATVGLIGVLVITLIVAVAAALIVKYAIL